MFHDLRDETMPTCDAGDCERPLGDPALAFETEWGRREAYECACGAVTVTVTRTESSR